MKKHFREINLIHQKLVVRLIINTFNGPDVAKNKKYFHVLELLNNLIKDEDDLFLLINRLFATDWAYRDNFFLIYLTKDDKLINFASEIIKNKYQIINLEDDWVEVIWRLHCAKVINSAQKKTLNKSDVLPDNLNFSNFLCQYVLAWAYEENKLTPQAEEYFSIAFKEKFEMLREIKKRGTYD